MAFHFELRKFVYLNREKWNGYVIPYIPTFMDGWTPDASFFPEEKEEKRPGVRPHLKNRNENFFPYH